MFSSPSLSHCNIQREQWSNTILGDREQSPPALGSFLRSHSLGAAAITFGLPVLLYAFAFTCNDVSGCPIPTLLQSRDLKWENLKADAGLLNASLADVFSWEVMHVTVAYYVFELLL